MEVLAKGLAAMLTLCLLILFAVTFGAAFGALSGWLLSLTPLGAWVLHVLGQPAYTLPELGCFLGFVGGFFRSAQSQR